MPPVRRVRVNQCVSAVRAVEVPVLVWLRSGCNHVTEVEKPKRLWGHTERCNLKWQGLFECNRAIQSDLFLPASVQPPPLRQADIIVRSGSELGLRARHLRNRGSIRGMAKGFCPCSNRPDQLWDSHSGIHAGYRCIRKQTVRYAIGHNYFLFNKRCNIGEHRVNWTIALESDR